MKGPRNKLIQVFIPGIAKSDIDSQTANQGVDWGPAKGNAVYKGNHDIMDQMEEIVKSAITLDPEDEERYSRYRGQYWW